MALIASQFKVASYNVENLFDMQRNGKEYRNYHPHRNGWDASALDVKLNNIAQVLCEINADIIALQEIENINTLNLLKRRLKRVGCEYRYHAIASKQDSAVKVALLSRFKITKSSEIQVDHSHTSRSILQSKVDINGKELILFVNHWKSKHAHGKESRRIKNAKALIEQIKKLPKRSEYIIVGDFNSDYNEYETMDEQFNDTDGKTGINHTLNTFFNNKLVDIATLTTNKDQLLHYNLWLDLPKEGRWSKKFYSQKNSIDSIIIPKTMLDSQSIEYKVDSFKVYKPSYLFQSNGAIYRWEFKHHHHTKRGYSDHLPIYATFMLKDTSDKPSKAIDKSKKTPKNINDPIAPLYEVESITEPISLKDVKVIFKRNNMALIQSSPNGRAIYIYKDIFGLQEGYSYDLKVNRVDEYKGLKQITAIFDVREHRKIDTSSYIKDATKSFDFEQTQQNELYKNIVGLYNQRKLSINNQQIPIFFKDRHTIPPNGSKIKINLGHIGYYFQKQIVVYDRDDFQILEK